MSNLTKVYRKRHPTTIKAIQWLKNGDHPGDFPERRRALWAGKWVHVHPMEQRDLGMDGWFVARLGNHCIIEDWECTVCSRPYGEHGFLLRGKQAQVCPGDYVTVWPIALEDCTEVISKGDFERMYMEVVTITPPVIYA